MIFVSEPTQTVPSHFKNEVQKKAYETLEELKIPFERVETDEVITMEDCEEINKVLHMEMVKTLLLCNRQKTEFYLFITEGQKSFSAKNFSNALGISRVSFAPLHSLEEILGTKVGAATILSVLMESAKDVHIIFDRDVVQREHYGLSDGTTTGYMKIKTKDILDRLMPYVKRKYSVIEI